MWRSWEHIMAENKKEVPKEAIKMNELFQDLYKKISSSTYEIDKERNKDQIDNLSDKIKKVINNDLEPVEANSSLIYALVAFPLKLIKGSPSKLSV